MVRTKPTTITIMNYDNRTEKANNGQITGKRKDNCMRRLIVNYYKTIIKLSYGWFRIPQTLAEI